MSPFLILLAASFPLVQKPQQITYTTVAVPVQKALREIATQTHRHLEAQGDIGKQPIIISVVNASLEGLLERIATVECGHWTQSKGTLYLSLDRNKFEASKRSLLRARVERLQKQLDEMANDLKREGQFTTAEARHIAADWIVGRDPVDQYQQFYLRALKQILVGLGADRLANLPQDEHVLFSTRPNAMQKSLGKDGESALAEYLASDKIWGQVFPQVKVISQSNVPPKIDVAIDRSLGRVDATIKVLPARVLRGSVQHLNCESFQVDQVEIFLDRLSAKNAIKISDAARWMGPMEPSSPRAAGLQMPAGLSNKLKQPEVYDPWGWGASEVVIGLARQGQLQLVATFPDSGYQICPFDWGAHLPEPGIFSQMLASNLSVKFTKDRSWLLVAPVDAEDANANRTNRRDLAELVNDVNPECPDNIEILSGYYSKHPNQDNTLASHYLSCLYSELAAFGVSSDVQEYLFYNSLTKFQRTSLSAGNSLKFGDLKSAAQAALQKVVFSELERIPDYSGEAEVPSESFPDGLPREASIKLSDTRDPVIQYRESFNNGPRAKGTMFKEMTAEEAGYQLGHGGFKPQSHFIFLARRRLTFEVSVKPKMNIEFSLWEHHFPGTPPQAWEELPEDFRNRALAAQKLAPR